MSFVINEERRAAVLSWFTGKAADAAKQALDLLSASEKEGEWLPKASRRVKSALSKSNVAQGHARRHRDKTTGQSSLPHRIDMMLMYGYEYIERYRAERDNPNERGYDAGKWRDPANTKAVMAAIIYANDFAPVADLIRRLDATRPRPVFTPLGCSKTITKTLEEMGVSGRPETIRVCPIEWREHEEIVNGRTVIFREAYLKWPENTVFDASKFSCGSAAGNDQCHACGHAIKNPFNWVPLLIDDVRGTPFALFVGRDCAKTLFGVQMKGELRIASRGLPKEK